MFKKCFFLFLSVFSSSAPLVRKKIIGTNIAACKSTDFLPSYKQQSRLKFIDTHNTSHRHGTTPEKRIP
jgi:hypothetical protein